MEKVKRKRRMEKKRRKRWNKKYRRTWNNITWWSIYLQSWTCCGLSSRLICLRKRSSSCRVGNKYNFLFPFPLHSMSLTRTRLVGAIRIRELSSYATWCTSTPHARETKTTSTTRNLPTILIRQTLDLVRHRHRRTRTRLPFDRLGRSSRLSRRCRNLHSPSWKNGEVSIEGESVVVLVTE